MPVQPPDRGVGVSRGSQDCAMALSGTLEPQAILAPVDDETTGQRIKRLRRELGWTQVQLEAASGVDVSTISLIERDKPPAREDGRADSIKALEAALDAERSDREGNPSALRLIAAALEGAAVREQNVRHLGPGGRVRYLTVIAREPGVSDAEYARAIEEAHRSHNPGTRD